MGQPQERAEKLARYAGAYSELAEGLKRFPREMWGYRPAPEDWTVHETVVHITDSEANSYIRCRRFLAEPGKDVMAYDEAGWAKSLHYADQSPEDALELFRWLRGNTYKLIKDLPEAVWENNKVFHPENGIMTMDDWLDVYSQHIPEHLEQMERVFEAWQASRG